MSESGPDHPWLDPEQLKRLDPMLEMLATSHVSLSSVTNIREARKVHVADSLSGMASPELRSAENVLDLGAGGGFPGVPLAVLQPQTEFTLIDSVGRKVEFINEVINSMGLSNARAVKARSEDWANGQGREAYDVVTARAVAPLEVLAELSSPLLKTDGHLIAWKGEPELESEQLVKDNPGKLGMEIVRCDVIIPFPGSRERRLYVLKKTGETPKGIPRRAGMARKRPLGGR